MDLRIALAGNPNSGKTTLFNALTGSNQFVGNWPGVTVEKKEGKLKKQDGVIITDLPGIYSLSPYSLEEVVARNYLVGERPDAIINLVDGTNLERNLYLTTQLLELGIPVVIAINMMDIVRKNGDIINIEALSKALGCEIVEISALKGTGITEAAEKAIEAAKNRKFNIPRHIFSGAAEHAIAHIEEAVVHELPAEQQRWYAIKIFERDERVLDVMQIPEDILLHKELKLLEHFRILPKPLSPECIAKGCDTGNDETYIIVCSLEEKLCRFLVEAASGKLKPTEKRCTAHRAHNDTVLDLNVAYFPRGKQGLIFRIYVCHSKISFQNIF